VTAAVGSDRFASELRRWRSLRNWSQLDLAIRADTTQRHLSFLEQGRSRPGRAMVVRLAESLELPLRERNALLLSSGYAPAYRESRLDGPELAPVREALTRVMAAHQPYPAVIVDRYADLVDNNAAFSALVATADPELLRPPVDVARLLLYPRGLAPRIVKLDVGRGTSWTRCARRPSAIRTAGSRIGSPGSRSSCRSARATRVRVTWASRCRSGSVPPRPARRKRGQAPARSCGCSARSPGSARRPT